MGRENEFDSEPASASVAPDVDLEKLGRQRPKEFATLWAEIAFFASIVGSVLMAEFLISGFHIILPPISKELSIPAPSQTWPSSIFSLVTGSLLLPFGRLGDMYGGYVVFNGGLIWFLIWTLATGFSQNYITLIICRAIQGLGPAAFMPTGLMLLGKIYRPGPRKNIIFALYGVFSPVGFFIGILFGGVCGEYLTWRWYFWLGAILLFVVCAASVLAIPKDFRRTPPSGLHMDWLGVATIVPGLVLLVYAITDSSHAPNGWANPRIIVTLILGVAFLCAAVFVEGWVAKQPLLPADLFRPKYMKRISVALFLIYGAFGLFLLYTSFYIELVIGLPPLLTGIWYLPMIIGGVLMGSIGGMILHRLPGTVLILLSGVSSVVCPLLFALMPAKPNYWTWVMPAMIAATIGIDITFTLSNIFITTHQPINKQGVAGAFTSSLLFVGMSFWMGFAEVAVSMTDHLDLRKNYQVAFWFGTGLAGLALCIFSFIRIGHAKSELRVDELEDESPGGL